MKYKRRFLRSLIILPIMMSIIFLLMKLPTWVFMDRWDRKRANYLLRILTIYTVISGIFGMSQVIEDFKGCY